MKKRDIVHEPDNNFEIPNLEINNNNSFEVKQNIFYWLPYNRLSYRFDSFLFLFFSTIYFILY